MLAAVLPTMLAVCTDKHVDCYNWKLKGECETNQLFMHDTCPRSCQMCDHECDDSSPECMDWMLQGECANNPVFMYKECPVACGACTPPCTDHPPGHADPAEDENMCERLAQAGECEANPEYVLLRCPIACGVCKPKCKDLDQHCSAWGNEGACDTNPKFMLKTCPETCRMCGHSAAVFFTNGEVNKELTLERKEDDYGCENTESEQFCDKWVARHECHDNPAWMLRKCAKSCGLCTHVCTDHDPSCSSWAEMGECETNASSIKKTCPASCSVCQSLMYKPTSNKDVVKDEL